MIPNRKMIAASIQDDPPLLVCADLQTEYLTEGRSHVISDAEAITAEEQELHDRAIKEVQEALEKAERQRKTWLREGRCEVCGKKLGLVDRIARHTRCKEHRQTTPG